MPTSSPGDKPPAPQQAPDLPRLRVLQAIWPKSFRLAQRKQGRDCDSLSKDKTFASCSCQTAAEGEAGQAKPHHLPMSGGGAGACPPVPSPWVPGPPLSPSRRSSLPSAFEWIGRNRELVLKSRLLILDSKGDGLSLWFCYLCSALLVWVAHVVLRVTLSPCNNTYGLEQKYSCLVIPQ